MEADPFQLEAPAPGLGSGRVCVPSTQWPEEGANLCSDGIRLLEIREMAAGGHRRPASDLENAFGPRARRCREFVWEHSHAKWRRYLAGLEGKRVQPVFFLYPQRGSDAVAESIQRDIGEQSVERDDGLKVPVAIAPGAHRLRDRHSKAKGRVGQRECEGLWLSKTLLFRRRRRRQCRPEVGRSRVCSSGESRRAPPERDSPTRPTPPPRFRSAAPQSGRSEAAHEPPLERRDLARAHARARRSRGKSVAGQRRDRHVESILWSAAMRTRVRQ